MVDELKMWLVVRTDIDLPKGKLAAQAGHGFASAIINALQKDADDRTSIVSDYFNMSQPKIVVGTKNEESLKKIQKECDELGIPNALITDEGRTVFSEPTITVLGIGPCYRNTLPKSVNRLQLLKD